MVSEATIRKGADHVLLCQLCSAAMAVAGRNDAVPVGDDVDGAAHVNVHKVDINVLVQHLGAPGQGIRKPTAHLHSGFSRISLAQQLQQLLL